MPIVPNRPVTVDGECCYIDLGHGLQAIADASDLHIISGHHWNRSIGKGGMYAATNVRRPDGRYTRVRMHRLILSAPAGAVVDHINGNCLDNRRGNLRQTDLTGNAQNSGLRKDNKSGVRGVSWDAKAGKWRVQIRCRAGVKHIYTRASKDEAAELYRRLSLELHGEFSPHARPLPPNPTA